MVSNNHIENIAIVGGGGQVGTYIVDALLRIGTFKVTAVSREDSSNTFADGVQVARVDYNNHESLVQALRGQDVLIVTMHIFAPPDSHNKLIDAAGAAGVPYVIPNWWGPDLANKQLNTDIFIGTKAEQLCQRIQDTGVSAWIVVCCSFWYEYSLAGSPWRYGFDIKSRMLELFDNGEEKISTSTFAQTARTVAAVLSLKVAPDGQESQEATLAQFRNGFVYASSFNVSQKDMFESVKRVTGTSDADWTIKTEESKPRYDAAVAAMKAGKPEGFSKALYTRIFYPTGEGSFESRKHNALLGLPDEDLDEATKRAVEMFKE